MREVLRISEQEQQARLSTHLCDTLLPYEQATIYLSQQSKIRPGGPLPGIATSINRLNDWYEYGGIVTWEEHINGLIDLILGQYSRQPEFFFTRSDSVKLVPRATSTVAIGRILDTLALFNPQFVSYEQAIDDIVTVAERYRKQLYKQHRQKRNPLFMLGFFSQEALDVDDPIMNLNCQRISEFINCMITRTKKQGKKYQDWFSKGIIKYHSWRPIVSSTDTSIN